MLKKATNNGTVSAQTVEDANGTGITMGIYGKGNCISLESRDGKLCLCINDEVLKSTGIEIVHVDNNWKELQSA